MSGEKTEKPTAKKRKESRKEGQVARTQELGGWASRAAVRRWRMPVLLERELTALWALIERSLTLTERPDARGGARPARRGRQARVPGARRARLAW